MILSHTENPQLLGTLQNKKIYPYISGDTPLVRRIWRLLIGNHTQN
jgi:hypothetical protein